MSLAAVAAVGVGAVAGAVILQRLRPSLGREVNQAIKSQDLTSLLSFVRAKEDFDAQATAFNTATRSMWDRYERALAGRFIREMGPGIAKANIAQYWLKQVQEVEPEIARETLDDEFLREFYNPEHAARCGKFG